MHGITMKKKIVYLAPTSRTPRFTMEQLHPPEFVTHREHNVRKTNHRNDRGDSRAVFYTFHFHQNPHVYVYFGKNSKHRISRKYVRQELRSPMRTDGGTQRDWQSLFANDWRNCLKMNKDDNIERNLNFRHRASCLQDRHVATIQRTLFTSI